MIFILAAIAFGFLWYLADRYLKNDFLPYLKWSAPILIVLLVAMDVFLFVETERMLYAREIGDDVGVSYSWYNAVTNSTTTHSMYGIQDDESAVIWQFHDLEYWTMDFMTGVLPFLMIFMTAMFILQYALIMYNEIMRPGRGDKDV